MHTLLEMVAYIYDYCKISDFCVFIHYYILIVLLYTEYFHYGLFSQIGCKLIIQD